MPLHAVLPEPEMARRMMFAARGAAVLLERARIGGDYDTFNWTERILIILTSGQRYFDANRTELLRGLEVDPQTNTQSLEQAGGTRAPHGETKRF